MTDVSVQLQEVAGDEKEDLLEAAINVLVQRMVGGKICITVVQAKPKNVP